MSENLHPHDEPWDDMPLPNEEEAWQKMNQLLDKEEKRRRFLPFWFWQYGLLGLLLLAIATAGYFLSQDNRKQAAANGLNTTNDKQQKGINEVTVRQETNNENNRLQNLPVAEKEAGKKKVENEMTDILVQEKAVIKTKEERAAVQNRKFTRQPKPTTTKISSRLEPNVETVKRKQFVQNKQLQQTVRHKQQNDRSAKNFADGKEKENGTAAVVKKTQSAIAPVTRKPENSTDSLKQTTTASLDSTAKKDSAKTVAAPPVVINEPKKQKKKSGLLFSAGVGLQQTISFRGQHASLHDSTGKRVGWFDYLPSVYLRLEKEKWFLQAEFQYRVPQLVTPFAYSQVTSYDSTNALVRTEKASVQKLYYRQIMVSLNRFVLPNWSLGVGGTYNLLAGAVTEQQLENKDVNTGGQSFSRQPIAVQGYKDSFLYRSTAGILLQTDYHWKRIAIGLRYTRNLQPFIKYTRPDGTIADEKNQLLQAILRFRIKG